MRDVGHEGRRAPGQDESDGVGMAVERTAINPVTWSQELGFTKGATDLKNLVDATILRKLQQGGATKPTTQPLAGASEGAR